MVVETGDRLSAAHPLIAAAAVESLPPGRRAQLYRRLAGASPSPERYAHFTALAAGPGPDSAVAEALDAAAAAAHARAGNAAAAQFAAQSVLFTPESDQAALIRRRIRAGELLFLAGDMDLSLEHLEPLDLDQLADGGPGASAAAAARPDRLHPGHRGGDRDRHPRRRCRAGREAGPRRRALVLALASDVVYGIPRAASATPPSRPSAAPRPRARRRRRAAPCARQPVHREGDGGRGARHRPARPGRRASRPGLPPTRLHDSADMHRGWSRYTEDLDTARAALQRCIDRARDLGDDCALATFSRFLATTAVLAGDLPRPAAAVDAADAAAAWYDWPPHPWHVEPRCELLIRDGDLDGAVRPRRRESSRRRRCE